MINHRSCVTLSHYEDQSLSLTAVVGRYTVADGCVGTTDTVADGGVETTDTVADGGCWDDRQLTAGVGTTQTVADDGCWDD